MTAVWVIANGSWPLGFVENVHKPHPHELRVFTTTNPDRAIFFSTRLEAQAFQERWGLSGYVAIEHEFNHSNQVG